MLTRQQFKIVDLLREKLGNIQRLRRLKLRVLRPADLQNGFGHFVHFVDHFVGLVQSIDIFFGGALLEQRYIVAGADHGKRRFEFVRHADKQLPLVVDVRMNTH